MSPAVEDGAGDCSVVLVAVWGAFAAVFVDVLTLVVDVCDGGAKGVWVVLADGAV